MLTKAATSNKVDQLLSGSEPARVQFPNHKSVETYKPFVQAEIAKGLDKGVIAKWPFQQPPKVVNGLKVADDNLPKLRLCISPMYVNLFVRYLPLRYEKLSDLIDMFRAMALHVHIWRPVRLLAASPAPAPRHVAVCWL